MITVKLHELVFVLIVIFIAEFSSVSSIRLSLSNRSKERAIKAREQEAGVTDTTNLLHLKNRKNNGNILSGKSLLVSVVDNWPFFGLKEDPAGNFVPDSGIDVSVMQTLAEVLNFTFKVVSPADGQWGGPQPDGNITGMIGMVAKREADFAINEITITSLREEVVDFSYPYFIDSSTIVSKAPSRVESVFVIFSPFTYEVWLIIGGATVLIPIISLFFFSRNSYSSEVKCGKERPINSQDVFFNFFRNLVIQNNRIAVKNWSTRLFFFSWFLLCQLSYAFYAGTLTAVLAVPNYERPIDSLNDLLQVAKDKGYLPGALQASSVKSLFEEATTGVYNELFRYFHPSASFVESLDNGLEKALDGSFGYMDASFTLEMRSSLMGRSKFHFAKDRFYMQSYGIVCPQNTPVKGIIDKVLAQFLAAGLVEKWRRDEVSKVQSLRLSLNKGEQTSEDGSLRSLSLKQLQGAFVLYMIGIAVAVSALAFEKIIFICFKLSHK